MSRRRIVCVAGVRPNFMKVAALLRALRGSSTLEGLLVHTGQHYDASMSDSFMADLELPEPVASLHVAPPRLVCSPIAMECRIERLIELGVAVGRRGVRLDAGPVRPLRRGRGSSRLAGG